jgi:hypothetical protein
MRSRRNPYALAEQIQRKAEILAVSLALGAVSPSDAAEQLSALASDVRLLRLLITPDLNPTSEGSIHE